MDFDEYFDFLGPDDIRLKGSRIGIESILDEYARRQTPEAIQQMFPSLSLEQVYAAILFYLRNKGAMDRYLAEWRAWSRQAREEQRRSPPSPACIESKRRQTPPEFPRSSIWLVSQSGSKPHEPVSRHNYHRPKTVSMEFSTASKTGSLSRP